ncbi:MAG: threonine--tRNA ligase [Candidatus Lokiarchaeota archaeon]|nr:threonine--tRNA ligase [Candidatus Lokiarchaeota archaeon]MBD3198787.1 threonine--tRNA ligase [Candidatus Lokiarchaeota archaeon]
MKILLIHSKDVEVHKNKEATTNPQEFEKDLIKMEGLVLVAFVSVEDQDTYDTEIIAKQGAEVIEDAILSITSFPDKIRQKNEEIREYNRKIEKEEKKGKPRKLKELILDRELYRVDKVLVYPWAHLSKFLSSDPRAMDVCPRIAGLLQEKGIESAYSPFGWYKSFKINCLGHELAEMYRDIKLYIQPEEHLESAKFKVITPDGKELDIKFDNEKNYIRLDEIKDLDFHLFLESELGSRRVDKGEEPIHIKNMKEFELIDFEPNTDSGNLRWYTKGVIMKNLIKRYTEDSLIDFGAILVDTPIMYTVKNDKLTAQTARFPARTYWVESGNDRYLLRFAGDFLQFDMLSNMNLKPQYFPLRLYEWEQYDFRREQEGELSGLRRLRGFVMPDFHTLCKDLDSAIVEFKNQYKLDRKLEEDLGIKSNLIFRTTQDFYEQNKDWIIELINSEGKPALLELWEDRYYYFILKFERTVLSAQDKSATLATIQIDVESSLEYIEQDGKKRQKYNIKFEDTDGKVKHPVILHNSPTGGLERILWGLIEIAERDIDTCVPGFKAWLSPVQIRVLTISEEQNEYGNKIMEELNQRGFRADLDDRDESLGKKIRRAEVDWIPYTIIVGGKEEENETISIRKRLIGEKFGAKKSTSKQINNISLEDLIEMLNEDTKGFPKYKLPKPFRKFSTKVYFRK